MNLGRKSIRLHPIDFASIQIYPNQSDLGSIRSSAGWKFGPDKYELGVIQIDNLVRIHSD